MTVIEFPNPSLVVPEVKAIAAWALWETNRFDTLEIAEALSLPESQVALLLDLFRKVKD
ncbi:MAG: hypothetical protein GY798_26300 [Hyphomicrobiales bacterium]|nr:hypothetical protein [Hyphomicrobiales bacterium]